MPAVHLRPFDRNAPEAEYAAFNHLSNRLRRERLPDDPPVPLEESIQNLKSIPPFVDLRMWAAWDAAGTEMVAQADVALMRTEANQHLAQFEIAVAPEYRRQGLGRALLGLVAEAAQQENRRLLMTSTSDRAPGGEAFMRRCGAQKGLEAHTNQLRVAELDRALVDGWLARSAARQAEFELVFWDGPYPDEQLPAIARLNDLINQQPMGDLEIEDMHMTPEQLRQMEANLFARGSQRWTYALVDRATGQFAGYTETVWNPNRPELLRQDMTGVFPEYRRQGLGRWLKAAMLARVLRDRPEVKYVRTGNADSNAGMLAINTALGFKPYSADALWQVELAAVQAYLRDRAGQ